MSLLLGQLLNVAQALILISFVVKDILWLRALSILASISFITFFATQAQPLWSGVVWNIVYLLINLYQIWLLYLERRPLQLLEREERIHRHVFPELTSRMLRRFLQLGELRAVAEGQVLVEAGSKLQHLLLVSDGIVTVGVADGRELSLEQYHFVGEMSYLTGNVTSAEVRASAAGCTVYAWALPELEHFLEQNTDVKLCLQRVISRDLARKLGRRV